MSVTGPLPKDLSDKVAHSLTMMLSWCLRLKQQEQKENNLVY